MRPPRDPVPRPSGQFPTAAPRTAADPAAAVPGHGVTATWWYTFVSMAFFALFLPVTFLGVQRGLVADAGPAPEALVGAVDVLFLVSAVGAVYGCHLQRAGLGSGWPGPRDVALVLVPPAVAWVLTLWLPGAAMTGAFPVWLGLNVLVPVLPRIHRRVVLTAAAALYGVHWWLGGELAGPGPENRYLVSLVVFTVLCPAVFLLSAWWWDVVVRLDGARRDAGQLAVARERLRFASDLHDIQGHHLQVIALKAELAERLLDRDPVAAREHVHEVRSLARTALEETRALVRDLRQVSLEEELANAQDVLRAAGAATSLRAVEVEDAAARTLFGLAVREAATNVLRHSEAATVTITLEHRAEETVLTVRNDGAVVTDPVTTASTTGSTTAVPGTGLAGLHRRFATYGGTVTGALADGEHVLRARLPRTVAAGTTTEMPETTEESEGDPR